MHDVAAEAGGQEDGFEHGRDERLAHPAEAERCHGDAGLAGGDAGSDVGEDVEAEPRPQHAPACRFLEAEAAHLDDRELGRDERSIRRHQQDDEQERQPGRRGPSVPSLPSPATGPSPSARLTRSSVSR